MKLKYNLLDFITNSKKGYFTFALLLYFAFGSTFLSTCQYLIHHPLKTKKLSSSSINSKQKISRDCCKETISHKKYCSLSRINKTDYLSNQSRVKKSFTPSFSKGRKKFHDFFSHKNLFFTKFSIQSPLKSSLFDQKTSLIFYS